MPSAAITKPTERPMRAYPCLDRILHQVEALKVEIEACRLSGVRMPFERRAEIEESLEGLGAEAQSYWQNFRPEDREAMQRARAKVLGNKPFGTVSCARY
jgi:hypothetical protein